MNVTECHWFMCILYYTFMYTMYIFLIIKKKKFPVKQLAIFHELMPFRLV